MASFPIVTPRFWHDIGVKPQFKSGVKPQTIQTEYPDHLAHMRSLITGFTVRFQNQLVIKNVSMYMYIAKIFITKTCLYSFDPLKPHFYIVNLGFTGVYVIFRISAQKHILWYSLEPPRRGGSNEYPQSLFWAEIWKISECLFIWKFSFSFCMWNFLYIWIGVFFRNVIRLYDFVGCSGSLLLAYAEKALSRCVTQMKK